MKQQILAVAAAAILTLGLGIANAAPEQSDTLNYQGGSAEMSPCALSQNLCVDQNMINDGSRPSQSDAEVGLRVGQQDGSMDNASDDDQDAESDADDQASSDNEPQQLIIIVQ